MAYWGSFAQGLGKTFRPQDIMQALMEARQQENLYNKRYKQRKEETEEERKYNEGQKEKELRRTSSIAREGFKGGLEPSEYEDYLREQQLPSGGEGPVAEPDYSGMPFEEALSESARLGGYAGRREKEREQGWEMTKYLAKEGMPNTDYEKFLDAGMREQGKTMADATFKDMAETRHKWESLGWKPSETEFVQPPLIGVTGDEVLQGKNAAYAPLVKKITKYDIPLPTGFALKSSYWQNILNLAAAYDPSFDVTQYKARQDTRTDFYKGKTAANITSLNTLMGHLASFKKAVDGLKNSPYPIWNKIKNFGLSQTGDPRVRNFTQKANVYATESATLYKQTGATDQEIKAWRETVESADSDEQLNAILDGAIDLAASRLSVLENRWQSNMGKPKDFNIVYDDTRKKLQEVGLDPNLLEPDVRAVNPNPNPTPEPINGTPYTNPRTGQPAKEGEEFEILGRKIKIINGRPIFQ